jgi:predicted permease
VIGFELPGRRDAVAAPVARASLRIVSPGYLEAMGIPLLAGRGLEERDAGGGPTAVLVNRSFADAYLRDLEPVGFRLPGAIRPSGDAEIVGVIGDVRHAGLDAEARPELYVSYRQAGEEFGLMHGGPTLVVRTQGDPLAWAPSLERHLQGLDPGLAAAAPLSMEQRVSGSLSRPRLYAGLLAGFAALALLLASIGVYAVLARSVEARRREIGVRLALGATPGDVLGLVVGEGVRLALLGVGLGLVAAAMLAPALASLLFGVAPRDPVTFVAVPALLSVVAIAACALPARSAAALDPAQTLRAE